MHAARPRPLPEDPPEIASRHISACAHDVGLMEDLLFLAAWEKGAVPWPGAILRVRQIRRAHPALAAALRAELARWPVAGEGGVSCSPVRGEAAARGGPAHGR